VDVEQGLFRSSQAFGTRSLEKVNYIRTLYRGHRHFTEATGTLR